MTDDVRILIVEDEEPWQKMLKAIVQQLGERVLVDIASNYQDALQAITDRRYELVTIDLKLNNDATDPNNPNHEGMLLLNHLRDTRYEQRGCGALVLTAHSRPTYLKQAFREYSVDDFVDKGEFDDQKFLDLAKAAVRNARLRRATARAEDRCRLTITCNEEHLVGSELSGQGGRGSYAASHPLHFDAADLVRRTDYLNSILLRDGADAWRSEARSIGGTCYHMLSQERHIFEDIVAARALGNQFNDLWIQFNTPTNGLGLPFELLRDGEDFLAFDHVLTRRLLQTGSRLSRKTDPFHTFIEKLLASGKTLRILFIGSNSDGSIPEVKREASELADAIQRDMEFLGIACKITLLLDQDATYTRVNQELQEGGHHIFHYAGHGRYSDKLAEVSGLILREDQDIRTLTAADLNLLVRDTDLQMVFLSCCLGARTAAQVGRGDFYGVMQALASAGVPTVFGYRWAVQDDRARELARQFYRTLWQTFSPGEALLAARRTVARGPRGRDDETWVSPVLVMQNG